MVSKLDEDELNRLESQVENGGGGAWEYLTLVRRLKIRRSGKVLKHGFSILKDTKQRSSLGSDEWTLYEQVLIAALDCQSLDVAKECIDALRRKFPESKRVGRLSGMMWEARGEWSEAEKVYGVLLEDNPFDQLVLKRMVALSKARGDLPGAVHRLNRYLEIFMVDDDAWRELAELYVSIQMYKQALFCYEELILSHPTNPLYHLAYADVLYTIGGLENLQTAKKYYASTIDLTGGRNMRAVFGICLCITSMNQSGVWKGRNKGEEEKENSEFHALCSVALEKEYKQRSPDKLTLLTSAFKSSSFKLTSP